jgi:hypothetical protein
MLMRIQGGGGVSPSIQFTAENHHAVSVNTPTGIQFLLPWHSIRANRQRLPRPLLAGAAAGQPQKASHRGGDAGGSNDEQTGLMVSVFASILLPGSPEDRTIT